MVTGEVSIDAWLLRRADGRPAGRLCRLDEQVWEVHIDGARRSVVHNFWCDVMACLPMAADPTGWTAEGNRWSLGWTGTGWGPLPPSTSIPSAWACRPGPDSHTVEVLSPDATTVIARRIGTLDAGIVAVDVYGLAESRYFSDGQVVIVGDGWADIRADLDDARDAMSYRLGIWPTDIEVHDA